jgi:Peptidase family M23
MTNFTTHTTTRSTLLGLVAIGFLLALVLPRIAVAGRGYGWPVAPFDRQHSIRGTFGDPRTVYKAPPTRVGLFRGGGSFSFHMGVDICAPDGTRVYPVVSGTVSAVNSEKVVVDSGNGNRFEYWHIRAAVRVGQDVTAQRTVLGRILRDAGHVHLTEIEAGRVTNPLLPGHLTPYRDTTVPLVASIEFHARDDTPALMPGFIRGRVGVLVQAFDLPTLPVPRPWNDMPMTPNLLTWRIERLNGKVVVRQRVAWDTRTAIPENADFWRYYARGTYQNMAVFAPHYSWGQPGCYVFRLATLDTRRLRDDVYRLVVTAADVRGNSSSATQVFSVHNHAGWVGV